MPPYQTGGGMIEEVTMEKSTWTDIPHKFEPGSPVSAQVIGLGAAIDFFNTIDKNYIEIQKDLTSYTLSLIHI